MINLTYIDEITAACLEMRSCALAFVKILRIEVMKGSIAKMMKLRQELANLASSVKVTVEANLIKNGQLKRR